MVMKYSSFIIKMVWLLIITNHQLIMAGDIDQIHDGPLCIDEEKKVLLELKAWLGSRMNGFNEDDSGIKSIFLPSWVDDQLDDGGNCCDGWERVICDSLTGHILKLNLNYIYSFYLYDYNDFNFTWSSTSNTGFAKLSTLKQLENLDISDNQLDASVLTFLPTIKSLRILDLSNNYYGFDDDSSSSQGFKFEKLSALKQLEELYINDMELNSSFLPSLGTIKSLKVLHLEGNNMFIHNFSSQECEALLSLRKLEELSLDRNMRYKEANEIKINISCLGSLPSLRSLSLNRNVGVGGLDKLRQLEVLNMSRCALTTKDVKSLSLSTMVKLKSLDLNDNNLITKDVLVELGVFPSLQFLNLKNNYGLEGSLANEDFIGFHHLETLNLARCRLNGTIPTHSLCKMDKLRELDLSYNSFEGDIPSCLNELSFLRRLDLSYNQLGGNLSSSMFRDLNSLEYISLNHNNNFQGTFSLSILANFSKLEEVRMSKVIVIETEWVPKFQLKTLEMTSCSLNKIPKFLLFQKDLSALDLSDNRLGGSFPNWLLVNNTRLQYLSLRGNHLNGSLSLPQTKSQIKQLDISNNQLKGHIPANIGQLLPLLRVLNNSFNDFDGAIPRSLGNMSSLWTLSMSNNNLVGEVPMEIMSINLLTFLDLSSNNLSGFSSTFNLSTRSSLDVIDISHNKMSGHIPLSITDALVMRNNYFSDVLPCGLFNSLYVDISYNSFTGALPYCSGFNGWRYLNLHGNKFTGLVPETILSSSSLITLDIGNNFFSGSIPNLIHDESRLQVLSVRGNGLSGAIPDELCKLKMLNLLDLSHNSFSGSIPTCLGTNFSFGKNSSQSNSLRTGYIYDDQSTVDILYPIDVLISSKYRIDSYTGKLLDLMSGLDLSSNNLEGEIPDALGNLSRIYALNLSHNWLSGPIPETFSNLMQIESLDLSHNNLSGEIPSNLVNLNFLEVFSVAYNNLSGRLPDQRKGQLGTFEGDSYAGNPFLCGPQLEKHCKVEVNDNDVDEHDHEKWYDIVYREGFFACFMGSYIVYILGFITVLWINPRWRNIWFNFIEYLLFSVYYFLSNILYKCFMVRI